MQQLEINDIQGLLIRGYGELPACNFILLSIRNKVAARQWIKEILPEITPGSKKPQSIALHIAFTYAGLHAIGLSQETLDSFSIELEDGMLTPHKQLFLGDFGNSSPANWQWGGPNQTPPHLMLMVYAIDETALNDWYLKHEPRFINNGLSLIKRLDTGVISDRKEHFGFHDGIAQPIIEGLSKKAEPGNTVPPGEFILGYKNNYDQYPNTPQVPDDAFSNDLPMAESPGLRDLGKNGSYLVFRQMEQDVGGFWNYVRKVTSENGIDNTEEMIKLASKFVGRWPSGAPITACPDKDDTGLGNMDNFGYRSFDADGQRCPIGSHIRRTNPRDSMDMDIKASVEISNKHRILRRGRSYGKPVCESLDPAAILNSKNFEGERGLHFICFNSDISRQFEFIQNAWVNNPKLSRLYNERDPIIGNNLHPQDEHRQGIFSIPMKGLRKRYCDVPEFVTIKGGAYFFMPGIKSLTYLSSI
ncbi:MAG TPA: Dyp-type peroxidase [Parafilimonas sp.]|nr:Dyp-type peroxidase [Parafilimonas sp.]